jgi:dinuclear metal center YbgI/SA1388 family protein
LKKATASSPAITLESVCTVLAEIAPLRLAESWDNVGLLVGDRKNSVSRIMTCLTISPGVVDEAIEAAADLIIAHHPLPFHSLKRITADTITGQMLLRLIRAGTAVYSAHTAFDSAATGINQMWAELLELVSVAPLVEATESETDEPGVDGSGRLGRLAQSTPLNELVQRAANAVGATAPRRVGNPDQSVTKVALACGSGGSFLSAAKRRGCDALITGEATFHTCLEAESLGIGLGLLGHYWSERFAMERLAQSLSESLPELTIWASRSEHDPIVASS